MEIKPSRNGKITLSFNDIGQSCLNREFFTSLMCLLMRFAKIKFSRKFPNLQYSDGSNERLDKAEDEGDFYLWRQKIKLPAVLCH